MKASRLPRLFLIGLLLLTAIGSFPASYPAARAESAYSYIVVLHDGTDARAVAREHASRHAADVMHVYSHALNGYAARIPADRVATVKADSRVRSVSVDREVRAVAQTLPTGIDRIDAEQSPTAKIDGVDERVDVDVAVIDTGIDIDHPDLNVVGGRNCSTGRSYDDGNGHGTHVAGTIGAKDNSTGVVGVAPGARLWAVRVLDNSGRGSWSSVVCGVDWVTANKGIIEVANMSLGGSGSEPGGSGCSTGDALHDAICNSVAAGVTYAVAAGNDSADAKGFVPAAYDEVITVSALADFNGVGGGGAAPTCRTDEDDTLANFSNYGSDVDLIAPGVCINSTWKGGGYNTISGTSMASPHTAGAAALYKANHPGASPATVKGALTSAGTSDWNNVDDKDSTKEPLLNVKDF